MALTPKLEIRQSQSLLMSPQLRQAINLLQMNNLELSELVEQELETNPLLEREDDQIADFETDTNTIDDYDKNQEDNFEIESDEFNDDFGSDREGYDTDDHSWEDYHKNKGTDNEDFDYFEKKLKDDKSLYQFLDEQIEINFTSPKEKLIAGHLCQHLDECGYFRGDSNKIANSLNIKKSLLKKNFR